jgi:antitoxin HicB
MSVYRVVLVPEDEGGFSVFVPALPGCYPQGDSRDEALSMAKEAIAIHLESLREHGEPIPQDHIEVTTVEVPAA